MSKILNVPIDLSIAPSGTLYIWCAKIEKNINLDISTFHCSHSSTFALREAWKTPNLWLILLVLISSVNKIQTFLSDPTGDSLANPLVLTTSVCPYTYWGQSDDLADLLILINSVGSSPRRGSRLCHPPWRSQSMALPRRPDRFLTFANCVGFDTKSWYTDTAR